MRRLLTVYGQPPHKQGCSGATAVEYDCASCEWERRLRPSERAEHEAFRRFAALRDPFYYYSTPAT